MTSLLPRLPERRMMFALLARGSVLWLLTRAMATGLGAASGGQPSLHLSSMATCLLVLMVGGFGMLQTRRRYQHRFLANLGVSPAVILLLLMVPAVIAESVLALVGLA